MSTDGCSSCMLHQPQRSQEDVWALILHDYASKKSRWFFFLYQFWLVLDDCDQEPPDEPPKGFEQHILLKRKCGECIAFYQSYTVLPPFNFSIFTPVSTLQNQELILAAFSSSNGTIESFAQTLSLLANILDRLILCAFVKVLPKASYIWWGDSLK